MRFFMTDEELERAIDAEFDRLLCSLTAAEKQAHWQEMLRLIKLRSPERILAMELARQIASKAGG
jgi:hypothetical protein